MAWQNVDLSTVNPNIEMIPEKSFTWELLPGAHYDARDPGRIVAQAAIVQDGEFTGRRLTFSYPDPESINSKGQRNEWSAKAVRRLLDAIGYDLMPQEDPVEALNKAAGGKFSAPVKHSKPTDEYPNPRADLNIFNPKAAA